jgi:valyl-tRNA synthetase
MGYITGWIVVGIITLGIYKLFELFVGKKERLTMIEKLGDKLDPSMLGNRLSLPLPVATFNPVITKLCNLSSIEAVENKADGSGSFMVGTTEYAIPLGNLINTEEELAKLEADLKYQEGFLQSVLKKLSNEKFVSKAPANVIDMERKKQADAESKIASLKESIAALKK